MRLGVSGLSLLALSATTGSPAAAQRAIDASAPTQASRTTSYDAAFFAQYAPRTALDIARRVPGFSLDLGNVDIRGFAAAAGNVVINGARPSSKAETLETTLARIPANRVSKVEVGPGDLFGADYSSKSQVLNIFLSAAGGVDATVTGSVRRLYTGKLVPDGNASALIRRGPSSINLSAGFNNGLSHEEGPDRLTDATTGELLESRRKFNSYHDFNPYVSGSWALEPSSNKAIRINARFSPGQFDLFQRNRVSPADGPQHDDNLLQDYDNTVFELGGDVTRPLAGGTIKLVGLATRRKRNNFDAYVQRGGLISDGAEQNGGFEQTQKAKRDETIGRLTWNWQNIAGFSFEVGGEAVLNTLDNATELLVVEADGTRTRIDLPIDNAKVKEKRGEGFVNIGKPLNAALRVDAGLTFEYSHLTVSGDAEANRKLRFWKPNLTVDWKPGGGWHGQVSVKRTVAQLDFFDFISFGDLSAQRINGSNADLEPQRAWEFRATTEHPLFGEGLVKLDLGYNLISKLQDRILIFDEDGNAFDAPGNIGTGKQSFATLTVDAPLGKLWKGLRVKFNGTVQRTRVDDPINGKPRKFSGFFPAWQWNLDVRRDNGSWSYGLSTFDQQHTTFFRTDDIDTNFNGAPGFNAFVEHRPDALTSVTLDVQHVFGKRDRRISIPNRLAPVFEFSEFRDRDRHFDVGLTVKRSFGGSSKNSGLAQGS